MLGEFKDKCSMRIAVDAVVFSVINDELKILLIKRKFPPFKDQYALPGGFVQDNENFREAVGRELKEETNVKDVFLKQLKAYGDVKRDPRGRVISVAFLALISPDQKLEASTDAYDAQWYSASMLPELAFDHDKIINYALFQLKYEIQTTNVAFQILPNRFTLTQLQKLYESILGKELDKRNFRKRIKELDLLRATRETFMEGAHRPARLYEFKEKEYENIGEKINVFL